MGANREVVQQQIADLKDYTDTVAAVHLLKEAVSAAGAVVTVGSVHETVQIVNNQKDPKIGDVIKKILQQAGTPGDHTAKWVQLEDGKEHLEAGISVGGAVYTVDIVYEGNAEKLQNYTVNITSKVEQEVKRGKLFFDHNHTATVKLVYDQDGETHALTQKGQEIKSNSYIPYAYQNEIIAKFHDSLVAGKEQRLAVMGTGSGKSIVMAGIAQAVGRTVMIVPDKTLVDQQVGETRGMHKKGVFKGKEVEAENVKIFTFDSILTTADVNWENLKDQKKMKELQKLPEWDKKHLDLNWLVEKGAIAWDKLTEDDIEEIKRYFGEVMENTDEYHQLVLQAEHPLFKIIADQIEDSMVLIDESHRHTFNKEDAALLEGIKQKNTVLALTATPTSKLYDLFKGKPLDDLSLGSAIELGTIRPIKPEVDYLEEKDLVDQAVLHYFDDYYLTDKMNGYVDPVKLKAELMQKDPSLSDLVAQRQAIDQALELNRIRCQRNMGFSDNKKTREELANVYQNIANGDVATLNKYQERVAVLRQQSELEARKALNEKFGLFKESEQEVVKQVRKREVNFQNDIAKEQQKDIQRTINSYALALAFGDKYTDIAEKDRTHKLGFYLNDWEMKIQDKKEGKNQVKEVKEKLDKCVLKDRAQLIKDFDAFDQSPIPKLPKEQKDIILKLIFDRAEAIVAKVKNSESISEIITDAEDVDLAELKATENYAGAIDMATGQAVVDEELAQIEVGIRTHIVADQRIATGVSIRDILNVQIINNYSPVMESDINVINGVLSGPQAAGRCVRNKDVEARAQQFIDKRYEGLGLILTIHEVIDPTDSAAKARTVMENRENQAKREQQALYWIDSIDKGAKSVLNNRYRLFEELPSSLSRKIDKLKDSLEVVEDKLAKTVEARKLLQLAKAEYELSFLPGRKEGQPIPEEYARNSSFYLQWVRSKLLREDLGIDQQKVVSVILNDNDLDKSLALIEKDELALEKMLKNGKAQLQDCKQMLRKGTELNQETPENAEDNNLVL